MQHIHKILFFLLMSLPLWAQDDLEEEPQDKEIQAEVIEVVKLYEPILAKAKKISISPDLVKIDATPPTFNSAADYQVPNRFLTLTFEPPKLRPLAVKRQKDAPLSKFWLKAGFGNYLSPYVDLSVSTTRSNNNIIGFNLKHHSAFPNNLEFQRFMTNVGRIFGKFYTGSSYVKLNLDYQHDRYHRYGFDMTDTLNLPVAADTRVVYQTIPLSVELGNAEETRALIDHKTKLDYHYLWTNEEVKENNVALTSGIYKNWDSGLSLGIDLYGDATFLSDSIRYGVDAIELFALNATPNLTLRKPFGQVRVGASLIVDQDEFIPFPFLYLEGNIIEKYLTLYGGWDKKIIKNNFRNLSTLNPFIGGLPQLDNSIKESRYIGFKGNVGANFMFDIKGGQFITDQQLLFLNPAFEPNRLLAVYDPQTTAVGGELNLGYQFSKKGQAQLKTTYYNYETSDTLQNQYAWHLPDLTLNLGIKYAVTPKLNVGADVILLNGRIARDPDNAGGRINLDNITDLNASIDYRVAEKLYLFAEAHNILNQKYQRYYLYPTYGINAHGGIILRF